MPAKRTDSRTASSPLITALILGAAIVCGLWILVGRGSVGWPPHQLLKSLYTVAGCVALVGPFVLARSQSVEGGLGELLWMAGGLLIWVNDAATALRGQWRPASWVTPLDHQTMGLTMLAVLLAGWRCRLGSRTWSWTNVTGWVLGLFWVGMALAAWVPGRLLMAGGR